MNIPGRKSPRAYVAVPTEVVDVRADGHEGEEEARERIIDQLEKWREHQENEGDVVVVLEQLNKRGGTGNTVKSLVFGMSDRVEAIAENLLAEAITFGETLRAGRVMFRISVDGDPKLKSSNFSLRFADDGDPASADFLSGPANEQSLLAQAQRLTEFFARMAADASRERDEHLKEEVRALRKENDLYRRQHWENIDLFGRLSTDVWKREKERKREQLFEDGAKLALRHAGQIALAYAIHKFPEAAPALMSMAKPVFDAGAGAGETDFAPAAPESASPGAGNPAPSAEPDPATEMVRGLRTMPPEEANLAKKLLEGESVLLVRRVAALSVLLLKQHADRRACRQGLPADATEDAKAIESLLSTIPSEELARSLGGVLLTGQIVLSEEGRTIARGMLG